MGYRDQFGQTGMSIVEVIIVTAIMGVTMLAMLTMQTNQLKSNNYLEFQMKRTQLQVSIIGQFLTDPVNCQCLFDGASEFPAAGVSVMSGATPTQIGRYAFVTPGTCATATMPAPFVNGVGLDGLRVTSISLKDIVLISGAYSGRLAVDLRSTKEVIGPQDLPVSIPVSIETLPGTPGNVAFKNCSIAATKPPAFIPKQKSCTDNYNKIWTAQFSNTECSPPACSAGETSIFQGCQGMSDRTNWTTVTCNGLCYAGLMPAGYTFSYYCPFGVVDGTPVTAACAPTTCPSYSIDNGVNCVGTNAGNNKIGGYCTRTCIAN